MARRVYERLIEPLEPTAVHELLAVVDGPLHLIPLEVLIPPASGEPWGLTRRIVYGPSASVLAAHAGGRDALAFEQAMLVLGAPAFDRALLDAEHREGVRLAPLPHSEEEVRYIYELYQDAGAKLLVAGEATLKAWLDATPQRFRYLHFATHAIVSDRHPDRTHLVFADGNLDLATIRDQQLRAELVAVSACESAVGKRVRGEGMVGLPHAFLASGARGVVVALWRIEDRAAADFMREFYRELHSGKSPAEALRHVRRRWFEARAHPKAWAPFIQVGGIG